MKSILFPSACLLILTSVLRGQFQTTEAASIRIQTEGIQNAEIVDRDLMVGYDQWQIGTPIFFKRTTDWTFAAGLRYQRTDLEFSDLALFAEDELHSLDLPIYLSKRHSKRLDWLLLFTPTLAGDYENINSRALNHMTIVGGKWKKSNNFEWILGALYTTRIGDDLFVPALGLNWKPSENSNLLFAGPIIRYELKLSDSFDLFLGGQFSGNRWNTRAIYGEKLEERNFRLRAYRLSASLQWNIREPHAIFGTFGVEFGKKVEIETANGEKILEDDASSASVYQIGYVYKF